MKQKLWAAPMLSSSDFERPFTLQSDISECGVSVVLSQCREDGKEHFVAFFSRKVLPRREVLYCQKEGLAILSEGRSCYLARCACIFVGKAIHRSDHSST